MTLVVYVVRRATIKWVKMRYSKQTCSYVVISLSPPSPSPRYEANFWAMLQRGAGVGLQGQQCWDLETERPPMFGLPQSPPLGCGLCYRCGKNDGGALAQGKRYFESGDGMHDRDDGGSSSTVSQMVGITRGKERTEEEEEEEEEEEAEDIEIFASAPALHPADDLHSLVMSGRTSSNWQGRFDRFKSTGSTGGDSDDTTSISRSELHYISPSQYSEM